MRPTGRDQSAHLLLDVADLLQALGVPYAAVGAHAASYHGKPRSTRDADASIWLSGTSLTPDGLIEAFKSKGYRVELCSGDIDDPIAAVIKIGDGFDNKVDLLLGVRGMDPAASSRRVESRFLDSSLKLMGAEDLVAMKIFSGGYQDLEDVRGVLQVSGPKMNLTLLRELTRRYGVEPSSDLETLLKECGLGG